MATLERKIGQLTIENDFFKKSLTGDQPKRQKRIMMFALMTQEERLSIPRMCELLHLSRASYYRWRDRKETPDNDMELRDFIQWIVLHRNRYGFRRVTKELARSYECMVNHKKVLRLMREDNLLCLRKRGWVKTTIQGTEVYPNLIPHMVLVAINQLPG